MDFNGKNVLVVGASSGIGAAVAEQLLIAGAQVFSFSRNEPSQPAIQWESWDAVGEQPVPVAALPEEVHGLVYCPGSILLKPFNRFTDADFERDFQINVLGAVRVIREVLPKLKKAAGASIVLYSTVASRVGMPYHASIAAAKGAVEGLAKSLAAEYAGAQIRVNCLAPSLTNTPLAAGLLGTPEKVEAGNKRHPLGRVGQPEDLAALTTFLLSDQAGWITGQVIAVDGGMSGVKLV